MYTRQGGSGGEMVGEERERERDRERPGERERGDGIERESLIVQCHALPGPWADS